jgi:Predicted membrane protein
VWILGFVLFAGGVVATLASDLGANPYDQIVRAVHERFGISLWLSRLLFDAVILVIAFLLGGAWGAGTVALLVLMPIAMGWLTPHFRRLVHGETSAKESSNFQEAGEASAR